MKAILTALLSLLVAVSAMAQEDETLISSNISHGGFGAPVVKFTQIKNDFGVLVGGHGGWIINHNLLIGGGGYGLVNENVDKRVISPDTTVFLGMGYGGVELGYQLYPHKLIHASFSTLIGAGGINYYYKDDDHHMDNYKDDDFDVFFIVEPGVNMELNVTHFFHVAVGGSYRIVSDIEMQGLSNKDISGPSANISLMFGKF